VGNTSRGTAGGEEQSLKGLRGWQVIAAPKVQLSVQRKVIVAYIIHICAYMMKGSQLPVFKGLIGAV